MIHEGSDPYKHDKWIVCYCVPIDHVDRLQIPITINSVHKGLIPIKPHLCNIKPSLYQASLKG